MKDHRQEYGRISRSSALDMTTGEFREVGHQLIEQIADFYESLPERDLTAAKDRTQIRDLLGIEGLPAQGVAADVLLKEVAPLLFDNSLHNGHPRFLGYISSSAAPLGALSDLLAAAVNPNLAKWELSPIASEIEAQAINWIAELIGFPADGGGVMVSGGNMANLLAFLAARQAVVPWNIREEGLSADSRQLTAYVSRATHTWIEKAADISGIGATGVRWIDTDDEQRICMDALRKQVEEDKDNGYLPFIVVGTAGSVSTGAIDPLCDIADFCRDQQIWMHVDGAYGAPAASLAESPADLHALSQADSVAVDPHKWLYSPIEAACVLTRDPQALPNAFSYRPDYYHFDEETESGIDYYQYGLQNTRGFRALKVWLGLRQAGREGYRAMIRDDIALAEQLHRLVDEHPDFEARSINLSITTFRYVPADLQNGDEKVAEYINKLNTALLASIQKSGRIFLSNAVVNGDYLLRACVVNFRTTRADIEVISEIVAKTAKDLDEKMRPKYLVA
jgi:glutamate/tyrosine decarboxylase-like PLP-dependent enzyme